MAASITWGYAVSVLQQIRRHQLLRNAEGYLDLVMALSDRWPLSVENRDRLAQRALDALDRIADCESCRGHVLYLRGQALRAMEDYRGAIKPLKTATTLDPENLHIHLALGWCYKRVGRLDLAIEALEAALEYEPDEAILHYNLACYWSLAENPRLALQYLAQAFDLDPNYRDLVSTESDFDPIRQDPDFRDFTSVIV